jgi:SynChlorMet cassette protein ScmC
MRGFSLHLGDGSRWWIAGSRYTAFLAEKLGTIMQLQEGDDLEEGHILFFYDKYKDGRLLDISLLEAHGWINFQPFSEQFCFHPGLRHLLAEWDSINSPNGPYNLMCLTLPAVFWESICRGGLPFHAALLEYQGQGVILAARGTTGKSTCALRVPPPWRAPCDDEVLAVLSPEGRYLVHPFPTWSDYVTERAANTWKVEDTLPLAGIFFIQQAPEDDCIPLKGSQAALTAICSAGQNMHRIMRWCDPVDVRELKQMMFANAWEIVRQVPAFRLQVSLTGRFWEKIEAALGWR